MGYYDDEPDGSIPNLHAKYEADLDDLNILERALNQQGTTFDIRFQPPKQGYGGDEYEGVEIEQFVPREVLMKAIEAAIVLQKQRVAEAKRALANAVAGL